MIDLCQKMINQLCFRIIFGNPDPLPLFRQPGNFAVYSTLLAHPRWNSVVRELRSFDHAEFDDDFFVNQLLLQQLQN